MKTSKEFNLITPMSRNNCTVWQQFSRILDELLRVYFLCNPTGSSGKDGQKLMRRAEQSEREIQDI